MNDRMAQIDAMVAAAGARTENSQSMGTRAHVRVAADGTAEVLGNYTAPDRIPDSGMDLNYERAQADVRVTALEAKLNAVQFDPKTGAPAATLVGRARENAEMQLVVERNNQHYTAIRFQQMEAQRQSDAARRAADYDERAMRLSVTGGNPAAEARLEELLKEEELRTTATAIMAKRYERGRG